LPQLLISQVKPSISLQLFFSLVAEHREVSLKCNAADAMRTSGVVLQ
jgi:hypothetical protein